jgi:6-phosphogluconolactonase (cycloisomerase 2 family)
VLPIKADGSLAEMSCYVEALGRGGRRETARRAARALDQPGCAANKFAFCADLGLDKVMIYRFDAAAGHAHGQRSGLCGDGPSGRPAAFRVSPERQVSPT